MAEKEEIVQVSSYERALILGDLAGLKPDERLSYYKAVCESVGLNPLTKPFDYITLNGKMVLYATRACTDQLRKIHGVSVLDLSKENHDGVLSVTCKVSDKTGRTDVATGALSVSGLKGNDLANALMKAETKAKRRATLSLCGLGVLDETELDSLPAEVTGPPAFVPLPISAPPVNQTASVLSPDVTKSVNSRVQEPVVAPTVADTPKPQQPLPDAPQAALLPNSGTLALPSAVSSVSEPLLPVAPPTLPPMSAAPVSPNVETAQKSETPATRKEHDEFLGRAAKLVRDKLPAGGMKDQDASNGVKNYLLKGSGKTGLKQLTAADWEKLLKVLEDAATPADAVAIVKACK